jgi:putative peptidoglycan lipid II flippase
MSDSHRSLVAASLVVMVGFVASRILGLVRNMAILSQFGAGHEFDALLAALQIPDLVFQVLAGGAVGSAFIPVFQSYFARDDRDGAWRVTNSCMTIAFAVTVPAVVLMAALAPQIVDRLLVPGWDGQQKTLTADLMRIMLISPVIFALSGFATSVLNSFQRFAWTAAAPIAYNLAIIAAALLARPLGLGIHGVAIGVTIGAGLHLLVQVPSLLRQGFRFRPSVDLRLSGVREVSRLMAPRMLGLGVVQLNMIVNVVLASFLIVGSLGYLNVAWMLIMSPLVLAMAVSTAVFPTLAAESAMERRDEVRSLFMLSYKMIIFLTVPASLGLIALGEPLIRLFFERGEFTAESTRATAVALRFYALGLVGHATVEIVDRVFYAFHDTFTPVKVAVGAILANVVLSLVLMRPLNYGGLALANALAAIGEGAILVWLLSRRMRADGGSGLGLVRLSNWLWRVCACALAMGVAVVLLSDQLFQKIELTPSVEHALVLTICIGAGAIAYTALAALLQLDEPRTLRAMIRRR